MRLSLLHLCGVLFTLGPGLASAGEAAGDARLREALRSATAQLRALEDDQARWLAKEAQQRKELEALRLELAEARKGAATKGNDRALRQRLAEQVEAGARATEALASCQKQGEAEATRARAREEERAELNGRLDGLVSKAAECESRTARLVAATREFLAWLAKPGHLCEPFLGLRRVALENRAQELEDRLDQVQAPKRAGVGR